MSLVLCVLCVHCTCLLSLSPSLSLSLPLSSSLLSPQSLLSPSLLSFPRLSLSHFLTLSLSHFLTLSLSRPGAILEKVKMQYLYQGDNLLNLMDSTTFDQLEADAVAMGNKVNFLVEGEEYTFLQFKGEFLDVLLPTKVASEVISTPAPSGGALRADGHSTKEATLANGIVVKVPDFVKEGDVVTVNTDTLEYGERV